MRLIQINIDGRRRSDYQRAEKRGRERSLHYSSGGFGILAGETAAIWGGVADGRWMRRWCGKWGWRGGTTCGKCCKYGRRKCGNRPPMRQSVNLSHRSAARGARGALAGRRANSARGACRAGRARTAGRGVNGRAGRMRSYLSSIFDILSPLSALNKNLTCESGLRLLKWRHAEQATAFYRKTIKRTPPRKSQVAPLTKAHAPYGEGRTNHDHEQNHER